ncbi:MAG: hypothetical protein GY940_08370, partial [bacterium]|nr:hypothetical protein [bacterium]
MGGKGDDYGFGICFKRGRGAFIAGKTNSTNFPLKNAYQSSNAGLTDTFITQISLFTPPGVPEISLSRNSLNFSASGSRNSTPSQKIYINNSGGGTLSWRASNHLGLSIRPNIGIDSGIITVSIGERLFLHHGKNTARIHVTAEGAGNSPQIVDVTINIDNGNNTAPPFGIFVTPGGGSTVRSSVPFTGWVLDDI